MKTSPDRVWPIVEASLHVGATWAEDTVSPLPKELVGKFLNEFLMPGPAGFAVSRLGTFEASLSPDDASPPSGRDRTRRLNALADAGGQGFQLLVATPRVVGQIIDWFAQYGYRVVSEKRVATSELFDGMFTDDVVERALPRFVSDGLGSLVGFAHDADPIWILGQP